STTRKTITGKEATKGSCYSGDRRQEYFGILTSIVSAEENEQSISLSGMILLVILFEDKRTQRFIQAFDLQLAQELIRGGRSITLVNMPVSFTDRGFTLLSDGACCEEATSQTQGRIAYFSQNEPGFMDNDARGFHKNAEYG
ncbi:15252_t:CDS:2, partial [Acaulospora colombiana]